MSEYCSTCWFRKQDGICKVTEKACNHEWQSYDDARACPTNKRFYEEATLLEAQAILDKRNKKTTTAKPKADDVTGYEQMKLF